MVARRCGMVTRVKQAHATTTRGGDAGLAIHAARDHRVARRRS
ncbi:hypothetical protein A7982_13191 [Minicystis rosea]|nr:hypothetical protein A7982_13191 [Minicystis rosea]